MTVGPGRPPGRSRTVRLHRRPPVPSAGREGGPQHTAPAARELPKCGAGRGPLRRGSRALTRAERFPRCQSRPRSTSLSWTTPRG